MRLFVSSLPTGVTEPELRGVFSRFGIVIDVSRPPGRDHFAFVELAGEVAGQRAIDALNGTLWGDQRIKVALARPR